MSQQSKSSDADTDKATNDETSFEEQVDKELAEDPRLKLFDAIDKKRGANQLPDESASDEEEDEDQTVDELETAESDELSEDKTEDADEGEDASDKDETGTTDEEGTKDESPKILSRAEFEEVFKDFRIKDKFAGEEVEVPVSEVIKGYGLEKHWTKKLQALSSRERRVIEEYQTRPGTEPGGEGPAEEEVQEKYDELYADSPYKAQKYLEEVNLASARKREAQVTKMVETATEDFRNIYPECTDAEWDQMNDPGFWSKHDDIVKLRDAGDIFSTFVTAYTRLKQTKVIGDAADDANKKKIPASNQTKTERKKAGQVIRTAVKPTASNKGNTKEKTRTETNRDYILALQKQARSRMRIPD